MLDNKVFFAFNKDKKKPVVLTTGLIVTMLCMQIRMKLNKN